MRHLALTVLLFGAACVPRPEVPEVTSYRDRTVPIASKALFDVGRFQGRWYQVARFPVPSEAGCAEVTLDYGAAADGVTLRHRCRASDGAVRSRIDGRASVVGPGRLRVDFGAVPYVAPESWVLWVDEGYRTAVIGTPDGRAGWILDRDPAIPADRLAAAREILDFNGYDLTRLERVLPIP